MMLDFGWILVGFAKTPRRLFKVEILTSNFNVVSTSGFERWINVWFSTLDQRQVFNVGSTIHIFCQRRDGCHRRDNNNIC